MDEFSKREKRLITIIVFSFLIIIGLVSGSIFKEKEEDAYFLTDQKIETVEASQLNEAQPKEENKVILIHISGAVVKPGLIELPNGSRLIDAINAAGGSNPEADLNQVNLSRKISDEERIHIPKLGESAEILPLLSQNPPMESSGSLEQTSKININTADKDQLMSLPGVGEKTADKIIMYRQTTPFTAIEDLMEVPGIGEKKFSELKDQISI